MLCVHVKYTCGCALHGTRVHVCVDVCECARSYFKYVSERACEQLSKSQTVYVAMSVFGSVCAAHMCEGRISSWSDTIWPAGAEGRRIGGMR